MRICLFSGDRLGLVQGDRLLDVTAALDVLPTCRYPLPSGDLMVAHLQEVLRRVEQLTSGAEALPLADVKLQSPVANPGKVIGAPVNYRQHLEEVRGDPGLHHHNEIHEIQRVGLFLKATSSVIGPSQEIRIKHPDRRTDHEVELAVIIGRVCKDVRRDRALDHVAGYCIGLDITVRGPEERSLRKSIDTYTVLGPHLVTADELDRVSGLDLSLDVNGKQRQQGNTRDLVLGVPELIELASSYYTLFPGDVILTGTPAGVAGLSPGDVMLASVQGVGTMAIRVAG